MDGVAGTYFAVWAPNAERVSVVGDFNYWDRGSHPLHVRWDGSGIFEGFIPGIGNGAIYKYHIVSKVNGYSVDKGDPFATHWETPPKTGSIVWDIDYEWGDERVDEKPRKCECAECPLSPYTRFIWDRGEECRNRITGG